MFNLPAEKNGERFDARQRIEELAFLVDRGEANLILTVDVEQGRFDGCCEAITERCRILVVGVQPLVEQHGLNGRRLDPAVLEQVLGERIFGALRTITEQVYYHVDSSVESLVIAIEQLHVAAKRIHPNRQFLKTDRINFQQAGNADSSADA
jgi:hypothetical protein